MNESQFIAQLKSGEDGAFKLLVDKYSGKIFNTVIGILQNREDAEDITQEVFIEVHRSIVNFKGESLLSTWMYRIAVSKSLEFLRKKNRKKRFVLFKTRQNDESIDPINEIPSFHHPGIQLENKERAAILFAAIKQLPEKQQSAFILHKMEDLPYAEIAVILEVTLPAVESLMFRAKQNLQKLLGDYYEKNEK